MRRRELSRDMISGAGHDAARRARGADHHDLRVLPRRLSHNEAESTSFDECAAGAQVLLMRCWNSIEGWGEKCKGG